MAKFLLILSILLLSNQLYAQVAKTQVLQLKIEISDNGTSKLKWQSKGVDYLYQIRQKEMYANSWSLIGTFTNVSEYTIPNLQKGDITEFEVLEVFNNQGSAIGYSLAANEYVPNVERGNVLLLIDSNYRTSLSSEISRLQVDLYNEGWKSYVLYAGRSEIAINIKDRIVSFVNTNKINLRTIFIIGHVPVPYSGYFSGTTGNYPPPDGHVEGSGNHTGAWPSDGYYGDLNNLWTDSRAELTTGSESRLHNLTSDGKFDQTKFPGEVQIEVGRVDLYNMPLFSLNDTILTKNYLDRNHLFRTAMLKATNRALIDNNFTGLNLASTGYHNFSTLIQADSIFDNRDYMTAQYESDYLWSYGCGAGSYTSCSGIGTTNEFVKDTVKNIFTILAGSYFGDWDVKNSFLKAPLANSSLISFWGGIPKWYMHYLAAGENFGYGTRLTMNNKDLYFNGAFNYAENSVHIALMGDPTLLNEYADEISSEVSAISHAGNVEISWTQSQNAKAKYLIYKINTKTMQHTLLTPSPISILSFIDTNNKKNGNYNYAIREAELTINPSGKYYKLSPAKYFNVEHTTVGVEVAKESTIFEVYPNPTNDIFYFKVEENLSHYQLELTDYSGSLIQVSNISTSIANNLVSYDLSKLSSGVYFLNIYSNGLKIDYKKIIKL